MVSYTINVKKEDSLISIMDGHQRSGCECQLHDCLLMDQRRAFDRELAEQWYVKRNGKFYTMDGVEITYEANLAALVDITNPQKKRKAKKHK